MKTSVGKTKLEIASGDITQLEVDAIVVPSSTELWMDYGVAAAIKRAGGDAIEKEAVLQGPVKVGEAVITTGHDLKARWVIHVALTESAPTADAGLVTAATRAALAGAERAHARSVALPAFGTGSLRLPPVPVLEPHGRADRRLHQGAPAYRPAPRDAVRLR